MTRAEMDLLANGAIPSRIGPKNVQFQLKTGEKVLIGLPAHPPSPTAEALLQRRAAALPEIAELHLFQMATQSGSTHTVIGIVLTTVVSQEREEEISSNLGKCVQPELKLGQSLDFLLLRGAMADQVRKLGKQIFQRPGNRE